MRLRAVLGRSRFFSVECLAEASECPGVMSSYAVSAVPHWAHRTLDMEYPGMISFTKPCGGRGSQVASSREKKQAKEHDLFEIMWHEGDGTGVPSIANQRCCIILSESPSVGREKVV